MGRETADIQESTNTRTGRRTDEPPLYQVMLHNDDYTPREFVVQVLERLFNKPREDATRLMWYVHRNGIGSCGLYPLEVAETKVMQATTAARENDFPLKMTIEAQ